MSNFTKHNIFKITSTVMAVIFFVNSAAYGISLSEKTSLRLPLKTAETRASETMEIIDKLPDRRDFLRQSIIFGSGIFVIPGSSTSYFLSEERKVYTEVALDNVIRNVLSDLKYPERVHDELIKVIIRSFESIGFDDLYKEAIKARDSGEKDWHGVFLRKMVNIIREDRSKGFGLDRVLEKLITGLSGEDIFKKGFNEKAKDFKKCLSITLYLIIYLRVAGFDAKTASLHKHILPFIETDNRIAFADPGFDRVRIFDENERYDIMSNGFIALKEKYRNGKTLEEMISVQNEIAGLDESSLMDRQEKMSFREIYPYAQLMKEYSITSAIYCNLGWFYFRDMDNIEKAVEFLEKGIDVDPNYAPNYSFLAHIYLKEGNYDKAIEYVKKARDIDPYYAFTYYALASCYKAEGDFTNAMKHCKIAIKKDPKLFLAYSLLGFLFEENNEYDKAIKMYEKSIKGDPDHLDSYLGLERIYEERKEYKRLLRLYNKRIRRKLDTASAYYGRGLTYDKMGRRNDAIRSYKKAFEINPKMKAQRISL